MISVHVAVRKRRGGAARAARGALVVLTLFGSDAYTAATLESMGSEEKP